MELVGVLCSSKMERVYTTPAHPTNSNQKWRLRNSIHQKSDAKVEELKIEASFLLFSDRLFYRFFVVIPESSNGSFIKVRKKKKIKHWTLGDPVQ